MELYSRELYLRRVRPFYDKPEMIKVFTGVRRCGKSSLMKTIVQELLANGIKPDHIIDLPLDSKEFMEVTTPKQLQCVLDKKTKGMEGLKYIFIDEVQNVVGFEKLINAYREQGDCSIFVTGSNGYLLSGELITKLTGRYIEFKVNTLNFYEYIEMKRFYKKEVDENLSHEFQNYILEGGLPYAIQLDHFAEKRIYVKSVIEEIFQKDIDRNKTIRKKSLLHRIQNFVLNNFGATMSIKKLCDYLSATTNEPVRKETVYHYLSILENAHIVTRCKRFDLKSKKALKGEEKFYLSDLSFYFALQVDNRIHYGPVLENIVFNYAQASGYEISIGKIGKLEVDFILRDQSLDYSYVQVAMTLYDGIEGSHGVTKTEEREYTPLEKIKDNYPKYVLTLDNLLQKRNGIIHENLVDFIINQKKF